MVKCSECGLLGFRNNQTQNLDEAIERIRDEADFPAHSQTYIHSKVPICVASASHLGNETTALVSGRGGGPGEIDKSRTDPTSFDVKAVIQLDRTCESWMGYRRGYTPKEHQEIVDREREIRRQDEREKADREWQEGRVEADRSWRIARENQDKREKEAQRLLDEENADKRQRKNIFWFAIVVTVIVSGMGVASAFIARGSLFGEGPTQPIEVTIDQVAQEAPIVNITPPNVTIVLPTQTAANEDASPNPVSK